MTDDLIPVSRKKIEAVLRDVEQHLDSGSRFSELYMRDLLARFRALLPPPPPTLLEAAKVFTDIIEDNGYMPLGLKVYRDALDALRAAVSRAERGE